MFDKETQKRVLQNIHSFPELGAKRAGVGKLVSRFVIWGVIGGVIVWLGIRLLGRGDISPPQAPIIAAVISGLFSVVTTILGRKNRI